MKRAVLLFLGAVVAACGSGTSDVGIQIGTTGNALACHVMGLQAKLQVSGVSPDCALQVNSDDSVMGTCPAIPTGAVREFRLLYFALLPPNSPPPQELDLAQASVSVDLRNWSSNNLIISYPPDSLDTSFDDDMDGVNNLRELCTGMNPRDPHG
jgi:hypothetical protein